MQFCMDTFYNHFLGTYLCPDEATMEIGRTSLCNLVTAPFASYPFCNGLKYSSQSEVLSTSIWEQPYSSRTIPAQIVFQERTVFVYTCEEIHPHVKMEAESTLGLFGFSHEDGLLIHVPLLEQWMLPHLKISRSEFLASLPSGVKAVSFFGGSPKIPSPFVHATDLRDFGYTIDYGVLRECPQKNSLGMRF